MPASLEPLRDTYDVVEKLGEGVYGVVYKAKAKDSGRAVAVKVIQKDEEGLPATAIREASLLMRLQHPHIVPLLDVRVEADLVMYLVFECLDCDLRQFLKRGRLRGAGLAAGVRQLCDAVAYMHASAVLHRDLKPQNVLVGMGKVPPGSLFGNPSFELKVGDFGLARSFGAKPRVMTHEVVTLWYRPPEILLGEEFYSCPVDVWSLGCIFAEMATAKALFPGDSEIGTLFQIFQVLGTPTEAAWPGLAHCPDFKATFPNFRGKDLLVDKASWGPPAFLKLVKRALEYDPIARPTAAALLCDPFLLAFELEECTDMLGRFGPAGAAPAAGPAAAEVPAAPLGLPGPLGAVPLAPFEDAPLGAPTWDAPWWQHVSMGEMN